MKKEFTITITIRPLKWIKAIMFATVIAVAGMAPIPQAHRTDAETLVQAPPPIPKEVIARNNAYASIEAYLDQRIDWLDRQSIKGLAKAIVDESLEAGFDPLFTLAVIDTESAFQGEAVSVYQRADGSWAANARGLMQVIPSTWNYECKRRNLGKLNKLDPVSNVKIGIGYLSHLHVGSGKKGSGFKRLDSLLLAYAHGPGDAMKIIRNDPEIATWPEWKINQSQRYAPTVLAKYRKILKDHGLQIKDPRKIFMSPEATLLQANGPAIIAKVSVPSARRTPTTAVAVNP